jgi:hypothetical protein
MMYYNPLKLFMNQVHGSSPSEIMNVHESVQIHQNFMICSSSKFYEFFMNNQFMKYSEEHS